ncbi:MAG: response regulator transcription factor [Bacteroidales bacterium]|jgi:DNA-binding NarL/FixJ family response regulator|nr:response regulator transcription factor [Bacteroidales bacterium]
MNIKKFRLLIVDDHRLMIDGLIALLEDEDCIEEVTGATSGKEALKILETKNIDILMADINMPEMNGVELTRIVLKKFPGTKVLALSMYNDNIMISKMIEAGALGYVLKSTNISELMAAVITVANGKRFLAKDVQEVIMKGIYNAGNPVSMVEPNVVKLTPREIEILSLVAKEYSSEQIAGKLFISERTVETHRKNILIKTKKKNIVGLIKYAIENGLIQDT